MQYIAMQRAAQMGPAGAFQGAMHMPGMPQMPHIFNSAPSAAAAGLGGGAIMKEHEHLLKRQDTRYGPNGLPYGVDERVVSVAAQQGRTFPWGQTVASVLFPWLAAVVCVLLFTLFYEQLPGLVLLLVNVWIVLCVGFYVQNYQNGLHSKAWVFAACAFTIAVGSVAGWWNYDMYLRDFWDYYDHREYTNVWPSELAEGHRDAAAIVFALGSKPDTLSSMGFNFGYSVACVAPIRMPGEENVGTVEYWAAGVDCCDQQGGFVCDDMRVAGTHAGLVIFEKAEPLIPFFSSVVTTKQYLQATKMAAARFGVQTVDKPIFVRWVRDIEASHGMLWVEAWLFWLKSMGCFFLMCLALATLSPNVITTTRLQVLKYMTKTNT